jgi:hypothetical protein
MKPRAPVPAIALIVPPRAAIYLSDANGPPPGVPTAPVLVRDAAAQLNVTFVPWTATSSSGVADVVRVLRSPALGVVDELVVGPLEPRRELGEAGEPVCLCASPVRSD